MTELQEDEQLCPYCLEIIKKGAKVCKHCHRNLMDPNDLERIASPQQVRMISERGERLKKAVAEYMTAGWLVSGSTDTAVQVFQPKKFDMPIFIVLCVVGLFTGFIPPLVYLIWWQVKKPVMVVLTVDENLEVLANGMKSEGPIVSTNTQTSPPVPVREQTPEEKAKAEEASKKLLKTILIVVGGLIGLCIACNLLQFALAFFAAMIDSIANGSSFLPTFYQFA